MTWSHATEMLLREFEALDGQDFDSLGLSLPLLIDDIPAKFEAAERAKRDKIDRAVRLFAREHAWPSMSNDCLYLLRERLFFGWLLATALNTPHDTTRLQAVPNESENLGDVEVIEWLLISCWREIGFAHWIGQMVDKNSAIKFTTEQLYCSVSLNGMELVKIPADSGTKAGE